MSRTIDARGSSLEQALTAAVAELLDCEPEKVDLQLSAPGLDGVTGDLQLHLEIEAADGTAPERPATEAPATASEGAGSATDEEAAEDEIGEGAAAETGGEPAAGDADEITVEDLDEEAEAAADFLEGLLDALDLPGDLRIRIHEDHAEVEVLEIGSGALIGRRGQTLEAIQELVRCALQRQFQRRSRVKVDAEGYRARRLEKLLEKAEEAIEDVLETGEPQRLEPMDVFERKAVHHLVAEHEGVMSRSQGREPARRVVIERE